MIFKRNYILRQPATEGGGGGADSILINGNTLNKARFLANLSSNRSAWIAHQGLNPAQSAAFENALADIEAGISSGKYRVENNQVMGLENDPHHYGRFTGRNRGSTSSIDRHSYDAIGNAVAYINGIGAAMYDYDAKLRTALELKAKEEREQADRNKPAFNVNLFRAAFNQAQSGLGAFDINTFRKKSEKDRLAILLNWANNYNFDPNQYSYSGGLTGEQVNTWLQNFRNTGTSEAAKKLGFEDYLTDYLPTEEELARELQSTADAYVNGQAGVTNPYQQGTPEHTKLEEQKKAAEEERFNTEFLDTYPATNNPREKRLPWWQSVAEIENPWDFDNNTTYNPLSGNASLLNLINEVFSEGGYDFNLATGNYGLGYDYRGGLGRWVPGFGELGHDDYTPWGPGARSLKGVLPDNYMNINENSPDDLHNQGVDGFQAGYTTLGYRAKFLSDYLYNNMIGKEEYKVNGPNAPDFTYLLPDLIDWNTGTAYTVTFGTSGALNSTVLKRHNIGDILSNVLKNNPDLYNKLKESYKEFKSKLPTYLKHGGVLKALFGSVITASLEATHLRDLQGMARLQGMSREEAVREMAGNRKPGETGLTAIEYARIGAAAADLTGAIAAWVPGYGTAVSAVAGFGSTATNLLADMGDASVSKGQVLGNLALNLGMDVVGLIPGLGMTGKAGKITKSIIKLLPKILTVAGAIGVAPDAIKSMQKLGTSQRLTVDDWKNISMGLSAVAGVSRMGASAYKRHAHNITVEGKVRVGEKQVKTDDLDELNNLIKAGDKKGALNKAQQLGLSKEAKDAIRNQDRSRWNPLRYIGSSEVAGSEIRTQDPRWLAQNVAMQRRMRGTRLGQLATDAQIFSGLSGSPWASSYTQAYARPTGSRAPRFTLEQSQIKARHATELAAQNKAAEAAAAKSLLDNKDNFLTNFSGYLGTTDAVRTRQVGEMFRPTSVEPVGLRTANPSIATPDYSSGWNGMPLPAGYLYVPYTSRGVTGVTPVKSFEYQNYINYISNPSNPGITFLQGRDMFRFKKGGIIKAEEGAQFTYEGKLFDIMDIQNGRGWFLDSQSVKHNLVQGTDGTWMEEPSAHEASHLPPTSTNKGINPSWITSGLETAKAIGAAVTNRKVRDAARRIRPAKVLTALALNRVIGDASILYANSAATTNLGNVGNLIASGTSDLGYGASAQINAATKAARELTLANYQYNKGVQTSMAESLNTANKNAELRTAAANTNMEHQIASDNYQAQADMLLLSQLATNRDNFLTGIENGIIESHSDNYLQALLDYLKKLGFDLTIDSSNPVTVSKTGGIMKYANPADVLQYNPYRDIQDAYKKLYYDYKSQLAQNANNPNWSYEKADELKLAELNWKLAIAEATSRFLRTNPYTSPKPWSFISRYFVRTPDVAAPTTFTPTINRSGGKLAEAERVKNERAALKLFYNHVHKVSDRGLKLVHAINPSMQYLLKVMMQG